MWIRYVSDSLSGLNPKTDNSTEALSEKFGWEGFLTGVSSYLRKNYEPLLAPYMKRHSLTAPASPRRTPAAEINQTPADNFQSTNDATSSFDQDISVHAQLAADEVLKALGYDIQPQSNSGTLSTFTSELIANLIEVTTQQTQPPAQNGSFIPPDLRNTVPYPTQSAPTQVLYEKARRAASTKANTASARRPGTPSQRRPWTNEEENTLMAGLDQVKGPHWSQILALYGPNGSLNDVLRDRNQVQLKDKARNLKLFFLKSGIEVPYYLQCVTGELKTRAPSQAAKREAEQRARLAGEDEQMRQEGISALNGMASQGLVNNGDFSGSASPAHSEDSQDEGVEEFQVVEPEVEEMQEMKEAAPEPTKPPTPPMLSDEEHLRQSLMAANAGSSTAGQ